MIRLTDSQWALLDTLMDEPRYPPKGPTARTLVIHGLARWDGHELQITDAGREQLRKRPRLRDE